MLDALHRLRDVNEQFGSHKRAYEVRLNQWWPECTFFIPYSFLSLTADSRHRNGDSPPQGRHSCSLSVLRECQWVSVIMWREWLLGYYYRTRMRSYETSHDSSLGGAYLEFYLHLCCYECVT